MSEWVEILELVGDGKQFGDGAQVFPWEEGNAWDPSPIVPLRVGSVSNCFPAGGSGGFVAGGPVFSCGMVLGGACFWEVCVKILVIADEEEKAFWDFFRREDFEGVDLILSAGDLKASYLEFLVTMTNLPLLYVHGNHDSAYEKRPPEGCTCIDGKCFDFQGLRIMGLGGSMRYKPGPFMYSEDEMRRRMKKAARQANLMGGVDILLTHAPARGFGDMDDLPHMGFECFNEVMTRFSPMYMVHGHVHKAYGHFQQVREHPAGTRIVNACGHYVMDLEDGSFPERGKTGSPLYDLYVAVTRRR